MASISIIDFSDEKYQVPENPYPIDLTQYETQLVGGPEGLVIKDWDTKDTVYAAGLRGENNISLIPENYNQNETRVLIENGAGNDIIEVGSYGSYTVLGGAGDDTITGFYSTQNGFINAGPGNDRVTAPYGGLGQVRLGDGNDYVTDSSEAWGEAGNDTMKGWIYADLLMGGDGDDEIRGGLNNDTLNGGRGNDKIIGGSGDDYVKGGLGNDKIKLGKGADVLELSRGNDKVNDFRINEDSVVIDEDFFGQQLEFKDTKKGCYITNGDDVNTFFKGVSSDLLATVVDLA